MRTLLWLLFSSLLFTAAEIRADAPLANALELSNDQVVEVEQIQADHRKQFRAVRGDYNRQSRALRRARRAADAQQISLLESSTAALAAQLQQIQVSEDAAIRSLLTDQQLPLFADYVEQRRAMVGSSRDQRILN